MAPNVSNNINIGLPQEIKRPSNSMVTVVLLVIICALFGWFVVLPKRAELQPKNDTLEKSATKEGQIGDKLKNLNSLVSDLKNHSQDLQQLDSDMPLDGKTFRLQYLIESFANSTGVTIGDISLTGKGGDVIAGNVNLLKDPYAVNRTLQKINGSVYVIGSFSQLESFLKKLETSGRIIEIRSMSMAGDKDNSVNLKISFDAYYLGVDSK